MAPVCPKADQMKQQHWCLLLVLLVSGCDGRAAVERLLRALSADPTACRPHPSHRAPPSALPLNPPSMLVVQALLPDDVAPAVTQTTSVVASLLLPRPVLGALDEEVLKAFVRAGAACLGSSGTPEVAIFSQLPATSVGRAGIALQVRLTWPLAGAPCAAALVAAPKKALTAVPTALYGAVAFTSLPMIVR